MTLVVAGAKVDILATFFHGLGVIFEEKTVLLDHFAEEGLVLLELLVLVLIELEGLPVLVSI